ncbi:MAG TPA: signal peptidase II [Candidatus Saccharimonadales bacterium]|nr:signal peptidase II [Candidatus Saccharimonadales bacterium]
MIIELLIDLMFATTVFVGMQIASAYAVLYVPYVATYVPIWRTITKFIVIDLMVIVIYKFPQSKIGNLGVILFITAGISLIVETYIYGYVVDYIRIPIPYLNLVRFNPADFVAMFSASIGWTFISLKLYKKYRKTSREDS